MPSFDSYGEWAALALRAVSASLRAIRDIGSRGAEVVETRKGGYRAFDPEVIAVDRLAEGEILRVLKESGHAGTVISEEAGVLELVGERGKARAYFVIDPFDGSKLFRRQVRAFWYTCLGIYGPDGEALAAAVADVIDGCVEFCNQEAAFRGRLGENDVQDVQVLRVEGTRKLEDAYLETYLMSPDFLYPTCTRFEPLFRKVKMIIPNGGPGGFGDVAAGRVDAYLGITEAAIDVLPGLPIAQRAGCVVTDFWGQPLAFSPAIERQYALLCSCNMRLHEQLLAEIAALGF